MMFPGPSTIQPKSLPMRGLWYLTWAAYIVAMIPLLVFVQVLPALVIGGIFCMLTGQPLFNNYGN
jgi:hypothetical protein